jgi:deazaflavin-dependent oxidoreductase (nitroreductase family)
MMSKSLLVITYAGRRSGKTYELPLQYIEVGGRLVIWAGNAAEKTWWRNFETPATVVVRLRGRDVDAKAELIDDPAERTRALRAYLDRYPITTPSGRPKFFGDRWKPTDEELAEVAANTVWIAVDPG